MNSKKSFAGFITPLLLIITIGSIFINFWDWDLWAPDEPRYAEVALEMVTGGNPLLPQLGGRIYSEKPPLFFWLLSLSFQVFGMTPFAVRIIPVASAAGSILITFYLGRKLFNRRAGLLAAMTLGTSFLFIHLARRGNIDSTLTLVTTAALALMAKAYFDDRPGLYFPAYLIMALGVIMKGPVAFLLPLLSLIVFLVLNKDAKAIGRARLIYGLLILIGVVAAWLAPAAIKGGGDYVKTMVFKQNIGRTFSSFSHRKPFYYYATTFPADFFPWIFFFPAALLFSIRNKTRQNIFPAVWFVTIFLFFSLISGKRGLYLLPLFPAAALMVGEFFDTWLSGRIRYSAVTIPAILVAALFMGMAVAVPFIDRLVEIPDYAGEFLKFRPLLSEIFGAGGIVLIVSICLRNKSAIFLSIFGTMAVLSILTAVLFFPAANKFKTARFICEDLLRERAENEQVILFRDMTHSGAYHFYTQLPLIDVSGETGFDDNEKELINLLKNNRITYIITSEDNFKRLRPQTTSNWTLISQRRVGHRLMMVFRSGNEDEETEL